MGSGGRESARIGHSPDCKLGKAETRNLLQDG